MKDYAISSGNEKDFIKVAEKLGFTELVFAPSIDLSKIKSSIKLSSSKRVIKSDIKKDRNIIESKKADLIYEFEVLNKKDGMHFLNSGLNQVLVKLMKENKISYGISFSMILNASKQEQAILIGRILQNIKLCRKYKVPIIVASFARNQHEMRDPRDLTAFARSLGLQDYK